MHKHKLEFLTHLRVVKHKKYYHSSLLFYHIKMMRKFIYNKIKCHKTYT